MSTYDPSKIREIKTPERNKEAENEELPKVTVQKSKATDREGIIVKRAPRKSKGDEETKEEPKTTVQKSKATDREGIIVKKAPQKATTKENKAVKTTTKKSQPSKPKKTVAKSVPKKPSQPLNEKKKKQNVKTPKGTTTRAK